MKNLTLIERYSDALIKTCPKTEITEVLTVTMALKDYFDQNKRIYMYLSDPVVQEKEKIEFMNSVFKEINLKHKQKVEKLINILIKENRADLLEGILEALKNKYYEIRGIIRAKVQTRFPLSKKTLNNVRKAMESKTKKKIEIEEEINEDMIGGIIISYDGSLIDLSIDRQLKNLAKM